MMIPSGNQDARLSCGGIVSLSVAAASYDHGKTVGEATATFPQKLMKILEEGSYHEIITWSADGSAFFVHHKDAFESQVMPKYFSGQSKFASFTRQLNLWGFARTARGAHTGAYFHPYFLRGQHRLLLRMGCRRRNRRGVSIPATHQPPEGLERDSLHPNHQGRAPYSTTAEMAGALVIYLAMWERRRLSLNSAHRLLQLRQSLAPFEHPAGHQYSVEILQRGYA